MREDYLTGVETNVYKCAVSIALECTPHVHLGRLGRVNACLYDNRIGLRL